MRNPISRTLAIAREWLGRRACAKGRHAPLEWFRYDERPVVNETQPFEFLKAVGFGKFMKYNGFCPRCGRAVEWSSDDPRTPAERRAQRSTRRARTGAEG